MGGFSQQYDREKAAFLAGYEAALNPLPGHDAELRWLRYKLRELESTLKIEKPVDQNIIDWDRHRFYNGHHERTIFTTGARGEIYMHSNPDSVSPADEYSRYSSVGALPRWSESGKTVHTLGDWLGKPPENIGRIVRLEPDYSVRKRLNFWFAHFYEQYPEQWHYSTLQSLGLQQLRIEGKRHYADLPDNTVRQTPARWPALPFGSYSIHFSTKRDKKYLPKTVKPWLPKHKQ